MKKPILFIFLSLCVLILNAQDYLIIFSGTGSSTSVETVTVENLTQGKSITLSGSKTLHLMGTVTGNTPLLEYMDYPMVVYPNPSSGDFTVQFDARKSGMVTVAIYDMSGREVSRLRKNVQSGFQSFKVAGLSNGIYTVQVLMEDNKFTQKVICNSKSNSNVSISYNGFNEAKQKETTLKSATTEQAWQYNNGDRLKFQGTSGKYSTIVMDVPTQSKTLSFHFVECTDADGNNYPVVKIGNQIWMAENLKTTKYSDGKSIPNVTENAIWSVTSNSQALIASFQPIIAGGAGSYTLVQLQAAGYITAAQRTQIEQELTKIGFTQVQIGTMSLLQINDKLIVDAYCWYNNDVNYKNTYGALYNWYAVNTGKLAPVGWHIATDAEWTTLSNYLGGNSVSGGKLKETGTSHWTAQNSGATNETGFTALPGGQRNDQGLSSFISRDADWWSFTENNSTEAWSRNITYLGGGTGIYSVNKRSGYSVRCILGTSNLPSVTTTSVTNITITSAIIGVNVTSDGGATVTARGVCWSTAQNPTIANSKTSDGTGAGSFTSYMTGLAAGTTYYIRAYATNSVETAYGSQVTFTTATNEQGNALNFDGINDYVITPDNDNGLNAFTIEAWVFWQPNSATDIHFIFGKGIEQMELHTGAGANDLRFIPTYGVFLDADNVLQANQWTHVAVVYNPSISLAKMYINGIEVPLVNNGYRPISSGIANTTTSFYMGTRSDVGYRFKGSMDEVRVWNRVRSQSEIQADLNKEISPSSSGLINYYNFNNGIAGGDNTALGTQLQDMTPNGYNGTLTNFALTGATSNWVKSNAMVTTTTLPVITTTAASNIAQTTASSGGNVTSDGGATVTARGVCWSTTQNPTTANSKTSDGIGVGSFTSSMTGLTAGTTYYVRAYAANSVGTAYGSQISFTATTAVTLPVISTTAASNITQTTASSGGNVTSDGGATVTARGVCWSYTQNPTTANSKTSDGIGVGSFTSSMTGLTAGTTYYVRAYATNSAGTAYGSQISFTATTAVTLPVISTTAASNITQTTASSGGNVTSDGGATVTARGVCWSTTQNPTIANSKTSDGIGVGSFTSNLTGLTTNTTYYVRAYAINSQGTAYGSQITFTTGSSLSLPTVTTTAASNVTTTGATLGGNVTSDGGATVTERGVCISTSQNPTTLNKYSIGTGLGTFSANYSGMIANTTYYVRAYAINSQGTAYGSQITFTAGSSLSMPTVTTTAASNVTTTGATLGGNVTSDGGTTVTERGVCISTSQNPTTSNKYPIGNGVGVFSSDYQGFKVNTTYYVRAYAINSAGTAYGNQISFTTSSQSGTLPTVITLSATDISTEGATLGGNVTSDGGFSILECGVWLSTEPNFIPRYGYIIAPGLGTFSYDVTGLNANTKYYIKAYATNSNGTAFGDQLTFSTSDPQLLPSVTTTDPSNVTWTGATLGGNVSEAGGGAIIERGVCINTIPYPTVKNKFPNGSGSGTFSSNFSGMSAITTYYVRAYAINNHGITYGNQITFTTSQAPKLPTLTTTEVTYNPNGSSTYNNTVTTGGNVISDGLATVTKRGVVWIVYRGIVGEFPTLENCDGLTIDGSGTGSFTSTISGLKANTTYYVRAYATNSVGTAYGNQIGVFIRLGAGY